MSLCLGVLRVKGVSEQYIKTVFRQNIEMTSTTTPIEEERFRFYSFYRLCTEINDMSTTKTTLEDYFSQCNDLRYWVDEATRIYHHEQLDPPLASFFYFLMPFW